MIQSSDRSSLISDSQFQLFATPVQGLPDSSQRIEALTRSLLGKPYAVLPLGGSPKSPTSPEEVVIPLDTFDCVTLTETVLSAVRSRNSDEFLKNLVALRYAEEAVSWLDRNHYSVDWIANNERKGFVKNVTPQDDCVTLTRTLSILEGYPPREHRISFLPVDKFLARMGEFRTGDVVYFGTTRENLDVSHVAFLVCGEEPTLLHATKSKGAVVEEKLSDFFARFGGTPGVIVVRPL